MMKLIHSIIIATLCSSTLAQAQTQSALMRFANNDQIAGSLKAISPDGLTWESSTLAKSASFPVDQILDVTLPGTDYAQQSDYVASVTMKNGDIARGKLLSIDTNSITLDTWFAGTLTLNRPMVSSISIDPLKKHFYGGPTSLDDWVLSNKEQPAWEYRHQAFIGKSQGGIARDKMLSQECSFSFDAEWRSDTIDLKVILFSDDVTTDDPSTGYELTFQRANAYLRKKGNGTNYLGNARCRELGENNRANIEIRASTRTGKIALLIDGNLIEIWSDPDHNKDLDSTGLHLITASPNANIRISNINVSPWNGQMNEMPEPRIFGDTPPDDDTQNPNSPPSMQLANGDRIDGEVAEISDSMVTIKGPLGEFQIPIIRFRSLNLPGLGLERCIRRKGDIRATFPDGSSLVFRFDSTDGNTITGSNQNFGTATFQLSTISHIEFNLYDRKMKETRQKLQW